MLGAWSPRTGCGTTSYARMSSRASPSTPRCASSQPVSPIQAKGSSTSRPLGSDGQGRAGRIRRRRAPGRPWAPDGRHRKGRRAAVPQERRSAQDDPARDRARHDPALRRAYTGASRLLIGKLSEVTAGWSRRRGAGPRRMSVRAAGPDTERVATAPRLLLGRDRDLAELYALVDGIEDRGGALVVRGEAGIGKSTLLAAAGERALDRVVTVVSTAGALSESQLAFAGLHQLLLPLLGRLDLLPDPQRQALETAFRIAEGDAPDLFLIGLATLGIVAERSAETPLLFVVDDAQWLDRPSSEVLAFVARRIESDPAVLLFGIREGLPSSFDDADLPELSLSGLDLDASNALLDLGAATLPVDLRRRILEEAAGNPLALIELPAAATQLGTDTPQSGPLPLTARLEQAFAS